jgi:hypothetical protein
LLLLLLLLLKLKTLLLLPLLALSAACAVNEALLLTWCALLSVLLLVAVLEYAARTEQTGTRLDEGMMARFTLNVSRCHCNEVPTCTLLRAPAPDSRSA